MANDRKHSDVARRRAVAIAKLVVALEGKRSQGDCVRTGKEEARIKGGLCAVENDTLSSGNTPALRCLAAAVYGGRKIQCIINR